MTVIPMHSGDDELPPTKMDLMLLTMDQFYEWELPPFQRRLKVNAKVHEVADDICKREGVVSGVITLGRIPGDPQIYLVDGQHRREGARISGMPEFYVDVRTIWFHNMQEMAEEFRKLNSYIVRMEADDLMRAKEFSSEAMHLIREECPFVGYDFARSNPGSCLVGMSVLLRAWNGSSYDVPAKGSGTSAVLADELTEEDAKQIIIFLKLAYAAWGNGIENTRLWTALNLTMCMWLFHLLVLDRNRSGTKRYLTLNIEQFQRCLVRVSASSKYIEWLRGRKMCVRDRAPCYREHLRSLFVLSLREDPSYQRDEPYQNLKMPQPGWLRGSKGG